MPQQAVTKGSGKKEFLRPQLMILLSCEVMNPLRISFPSPTGFPFCGAANR